jgi:hypothetical protein
MRDWFVGWQKFFGKVDQQAAVVVAPVQRWNLSATPALQWTSAEARVLLDCEVQKTICAITDYTCSQLRQTVVLGWDLAAHQVLLDDFFPRPTGSPVGGRFQLQLPMGAKAVMLQLVVRDEIGIAAAPAYVAEVVDKSVLGDAHLSKRLEFSGASAPKVDLLVPFSPHLRGHLVNLSEDECSMVYYGADTPKLFTRAGECRIDISERFVLRAKVQVQQVRPRRKPFRHTLIRIRFSELPATDRDRLRALLNGVTTAANVDTA